MEVPTHVRKRTISDIAVHGDEHAHPKEQPSRRRAPTLGAMGGFDLAKFRYVVCRLGPLGVARLAFWLYAIIYLQENA